MFPLESGRDARRSRCPDCHRLSVTVRFKPMDGDCLECRYRDCDFFAFKDSEYPQDHAVLMRWERANGNPGYWRYAED